MGLAGSCRKITQNNADLRIRISGRMPVIGDGGLKQGNGVERKMPKRIQRRRTKGWKMPPCTVIVDRSSGFGNPFPVAKAKSTHMGKTTDVWIVGTWEGPAMWIRDTKAEAAELAVAAFKSWIEQPSQQKLLETAKRKLRGKNLACWCGADQPCHADVLLELANQ